MIGGQGPIEKSGQWQKHLSDGVGSQEKTKIDWEGPKYYGQRSICLKERINVLILMLL